MSMTFPMRIKKKHGKPDLVVQLNPHDIMTQDNIVKLTALIVNTVSNGGLLSLGQNFERAMPAASLKLGGKAMPHVASCFKYGDPPAEAPQVVNRRRLDHDIATDAAHWDQISSEDVTVRDTKWDDRQIRRFCVPVAMRPVNLAGHPGAVIPYLIKGLRATRRTIMYNARFGRDAGTTTDSVHPMGMECGGHEYVLLNTVANRKKSNGEDERCMWVEVVIGHKEGIVEATKTIYGKDIVNAFILDPITRQPKSLDDYQIADLIEHIKKAALQPTDKSRRAAKCEFLSNYHVSFQRPVEFRLKQRLSIEEFAVHGLSVVAVIGVDFLSQLPVQG